MSSKPTFYEFFAGGGMAREGLGADWECLFANDFDPVKAKAYQANWGEAEFRFGDIHGLETRDLPGAADLVWASFPCQDLSLAGNGAGLKGERSGAFWGLYNLVSGLRAERRAPRLMVLENVVGALTSSQGADFSELCRALAALGYRFGAVVIDAVHFLPQSRPRLFIVGVRADVPLPAALVADAPSAPWHSKALLAAQARLRPDLRKQWIWWHLPPPPKWNTRLIDLIEDDPVGVEWHARAETQRFIAMMSDVNRAKLKAAKASGERMAGTIYRRTRHDEMGNKVQRAEIRFDGIAGCLRTPGGGSSKQFLIFVEGASVRTRLLSAREAARLMGLPESYKLPERYSDSYHLVGDGLAVPAVRFLRESLLESLVQIIDGYLVAAE